MIPAWCSNAPESTHLARWVFSFLGATLHPLAAKIHDDPRILRPATADPVAMRPGCPKGRTGRERRSRWAVKADALQIGPTPSRGWRGPQAEGRGLGPLEGTPTSNLGMGRRPEWALPLQTLSACRPEGPATSVTIIMGVYLESPRQTPWVLDYFSSRMQSRISDSKNHSTMC